MYIAAFRCTIGAIQKALLGIMSKKDHSNGYQRMLSLDPSGEELSLSNLQSLLSREEDVSPNSYTAFFYRPLNAPDFVCMRTPLEDGWQTLFNVLSLELGVESCRISASSGREDFYCFQSYQQGKERIVYLMKDTKWIFYEKGERLPCEQSDMYAKQRIRDRLNEPMLLDYLLQVGLDVRDSLFYHSKDNVLVFYYTWEGLI